MDALVTPARAGVLIPLLEASEDVIIFNPLLDAAVAGPVVNSPEAKIMDCEPSGNAALPTSQSICSHEKTREDLSER